MKLVSTVVFALVAVGVGAGGAIAYDNFFWDKELRTQLAEKDKMVAALNDDITGLRSGLKALDDKNKQAIELLDSSGRDVNAMMKTNQNAQDKLNSVITRIVKMVNDTRARLAQ